MHALSGALPVPFASVQVTRGALIAHRYSHQYSLPNLTVPPDFYTSLNITMERSWSQCVRSCGTSRF